MSKPKNMTPEQEAAWREKVRAQAKAWREANPEKVRAQQKARREANPEKVRAQVKARREANPEKVRAQQKAWREANPEKVRAQAKARCEALSNDYVANILGMPVSEAHPELLELKREQLALKRLTKQLTKEIENAE